MERSVNPSYQENKKGFNEILPIIKPCIPENRARNISASHN